MSSSLVSLKTCHVEWQKHVKSVGAQTSSHWCRVEVRRDGMLAQVLSSSHDHGSKLRGPSPKTLKYRTVACFVTGSSPVPLKIRRVGQRCTLNLSRAETSSRWCGVVVRRGGASSGVVHVT
ncbi:uncharacterized protein TNCV_8451 [Trichonephila clavipes]|nr:uncharacterized protein TNCV_8451 [Trichonephila clavipes]